MAYSPSYLMLSRHNIYYFRYPLPVANQSTIKLSLRTRSPKQALRLSKALEYYGEVLKQKVNLEMMKHKEIVELYKSYFSEALDHIKQQIDDNGPLTDHKVSVIHNELKWLESMARDKDDTLLEHLGLEEIKNSPEYKTLKSLISRFDLDVAEDSEEFAKLKSFHKYAKVNFLNDVLKYNDSVKSYSLLETAQSMAEQAKNFGRPENRLHVLVSKFMEEQARSGGLIKKSLEEREGHMNYLIELLGKEFDVVRLDSKVAQKVKEALLKTPASRNKKRALKNLTLQEQIKLDGVETLSNGSINKYLGSYRVFLDYLISHSYDIAKNYFANMNLKDKKKGKRDQFAQAEVSSILSHVEQFNESKSAAQQRNYWGSLIAVYTGSRLNEFCSLTPDDVIQDEKTGIWYFNITDEEETKKIKTEAGKRTVPVHSELIELGFLKFVKMRKGLAKSDDKLRLLPELIYKENTGWGRKFGDWFNNSLLVKLGLKVKHRKTLHSLRHSFITNLDAAGVEANRIKSLVGHEDGTVTGSVYTHMGLNHLGTLKDAIEKLRYYSEKV